MRALEHGGAPYDLANISRPAVGSCHHRGATGASALPMRLPGRCLWTNCWAANCPRRPGRGLIRLEVNALYGPRTV